MAEELPASAREGIDPLAISLALSGASRDKADAFLDDQRRHMHEQLKEIGLRLWELRLGVMLRVVTMVVGVAVAAALAFMVWNAAHSNGLLVEPFSVPPDLAQRGMTGEVVAARLLDQLSQMQAQTNSARAAQSYTNDWGQSGLKLDIPETGISLGELDGFLREKLGHDTHITGEVVHTPSGIGVTARASGAGAETATGSEAELEALVQKSAEAIYRLTQPFRYGMYLASHDRVAEAIAVFKILANTGSRQDRAWAYPYWSLLAGEEDGRPAEMKLIGEALAEEPDNIQAHLIAGTMYGKESRPEQAVRESKTMLRLLSYDRLGMYSPQSALRLKPSAQAGIDFAFGAFADAVQAFKTYVHSATAAAAVVSARLAAALAAQHDLAAARAVLAGMANYPLDFQHGDTVLYTIQGRMLVDSAAQDWAGVVSDTDQLAPLIASYPGLASFLPTMTAPLLAYAQARLGRISAAAAGIAATPLDCYDCLIARARIAELEGRHAQADQWFVRAIGGQRSIPFAYADWGQALLERGQPDAAIAQFTLANRKGPRFADPLEGWGEALMAKNQSHLALAKFAEAGKYAPNWGRLHLKWGEALVYAGKKDEARAQFAQAATLDLTPAEKTELTGMAHG